MFLVFYTLFEHSNYNKIYHNINSWKILQEKSLRQEEFDNLYFWNTLNKTHQEVGEEDIYHHIYIYIYISKICTMHVKMVTRPMYERKEVSTPPNKMKHISPLQRHVFLPLTCRILKKKPQSLQNFSPFLSWLTKGTRS